MSWMYGALIVLLCIIGGIFGWQVRENRMLKEELEEVEERGYIPTRFIFYKRIDSKYLSEMQTLIFNSRAEAGFEWTTESKAGYSITKFTNGDELMVFIDGAIEWAPLKKRQIEDYKIKIFLDNQLDKGAERALIEGLGLTDYMVQIGVCSEKNGGK